MMDKIMKEMKKMKKMLQVVMKTFDSFTYHADVQHKSARAAEDTSK